MSEASRKCSQPTLLDSLSAISSRGGGGWSLALRLAGVHDSHECWTGSCPCQPWSDANVWEGGGKGKQDERHLWPDWFRLIRKRRPPEVWGEQVPGAIGKGWLDEVFDDLEGEDYACGATVLRASSCGARHQRRRVFFVAHASGERRQRHQPEQRFSFSAASAFAKYGDPLADARKALAGDISGLLPCDGLSVVMERSAVKVFGNAIVPQVAAAFIQAFLEAKGERC